MKGKRFSYYVTIDYPPEQGDVEKLMSSKPITSNLAVKLVLNFST